jgi:hypothetical protein
MFGKSNELFENVVKKGLYYANRRNNKFHTVIINYISEKNKTWDRTRSRPVFSRNLARISDGTPAIPTEKVRSFTK